ncbi:MAG: hypothetical protein ACOC2G_02450 [Bacillota bacterium]
MQEKLVHNPEKIFNKFSEQKNKMLILNPVMFMDICDLEKRRAERKEYAIYLIHYKLEYKSEFDSNRQVTEKERGENQKIKKRVEKRLRQTIIDNLLNFEIITSWKEGHYIQLAVDYTLPEVQEKICKVKSEFSSLRLKNQLFSDFVSLNCSYEKFN